MKLALYPLNPTTKNIKQMTSGMKIATCSLFKKSLDLNECPKPFSSNNSAVGQATAAATVNRHRLIITTLKRPQQKSVINPHRGYVMIMIASIAYTANSVKTSSLLYLCGALRLSIVPTAKNSASV